MSSSPPGGVPEGAEDREKGREALPGQGRAGLGKRGFLGAPTTSLTQRWGYLVLDFVVSVFSLWGHREAASPWEGSVCEKRAAGHSGCVVLQTGEGVNDARKGVCANHVSTLAGFLKVRAAPAGPRSSSSRVPGVSEWDLQPASGVCPRPLLCLAPGCDCCCCLLLPGCGPGAGEGRRKGCQGLLLGRAGLPHAAHTQQCPWIGGRAPRPVQQVPSDAFPSVCLRVSRKGSLVWFPGRLSSRVRRLHSRSPAGRLRTSISHSASTSSDLPQFLHLGAKERVQG